MVTGSTRNLKSSIWPRILLWLLVLLLLVWALRDVRLPEILNTLNRLSWWQAALLLAANSGLVVLFGARWWLLIHGHHKTITIPRMAGYWLAGFGVDYITPGPGVGGEPLQVALFYRYQDMRASLATAAVAVDRLVDVSVNFAVLSTCTALVLRWQIFPGQAILRTELLLVGLLAIFGSLLAALMRGALPFHWLAERMPEKLARSRLAGFLQRTEQQLSPLLRDHPWRFMGAVLLSLMIWIGFFAEFWLILRFLDLSPTIPQLLTAVTAHRVAFLLPLPGGLGALEASQVFAFRSLGLDPAVALSVALVIRARDMLVTGLGLAWGSWLIGGWSRLRQGQPIESETRED